MKRIYYFLIISAFLSACSGDDEIDIIPVDRPERVYPAQIASPLNDEQYVIGDIVSVDIKVNQKEKVEGVKLFVNDTLYADNLENIDQTIEISTDQGKVGWINVRLEYTDDKNELRSDTRSIVFFSDVIPKQKVAKIVNTYPHSKYSYTQGLEFYLGKMFESTGTKGQSFIGEVDIESGTVLRQLDLDNAFFGEGMTILNDTIYQITYQSNMCFVYDMDFKKINEFTYSGEGWGLCNDGNNLVMSNGSAEIVWRNPRTFEVVKRIYVFDKEHSVENLNELELISGRLFANIYTESRIVEIDTSNGKVLSYVDCNELVIDGKVAGADVLNGIAFNPDNGKIYMTGKWWPKLYEVKFE